MSNIAEAFGYKSDDKLYRTTSELVTSDHGIGVEVEIENVIYDWQRDAPDIPKAVYFRHSNQNELPNLSKYWNIVKDGSLRKGVEFIFREAYKGANITEALATMNSFLSIYRHNGLPPIASDRCSIHVHLDARDMDEYQLNNILLIYILIERILFKHVNPLRVKNNYCRPLSDSAFIYVLNDLKRVALSKQISDLPNIISNSCDKYSALNIRPLIKYGSIEFRHHQGTTDMSQVKDWINIILTLKCLAMSTDIKDILAIYEKKPIRVLTDLFGQTVLAEPTFIDSFEWELELARGYNDVKEIFDFDNLDKASKLKYSKKKTNEKTLIARYIEKNNITVPEVNKSTKQSPTEEINNEPSTTIDAQGDASVRIRMMSVADRSTPSDYSQFSGRATGLRPTLTDNLSWDSMPPGMEALLRVSTNTTETSEEVPRIVNLSSYQIGVLSPRIQEQIYLLRTLFNQPRPQEQ